MPSKKPLIYSELAAFEEFYQQIFYTNSMIIRMILL